MMQYDMMGSTMWAGHWLWMLAIAILVVVPVWRICQRTGYPGWLGILVLVPVANLVLLYFIALAPWPAEKANSGD
jgi:hypothetical protein